MGVYHLPLRRRSTGQAPHGTEPGLRLSTNTAVALAIPARSSPPEALDKDGFGRGTRGQSASRSARLRIAERLTRTPDLWPGSVEESLTCLRSVLVPRPSAPDVPGQRRRVRAAPLARRNPPSFSDAEFPTSKFRKVTRDERGLGCARRALTDGCRRDRAGPPERRRGRLCEHGGCPEAVFGEAPRSPGDSAPASHWRSPRPSRSPAASSSLHGPRCRPSNTPTRSTP